MKILCPNCETVFKITDAQLNSADGYVQCGQCEEIFNALEQTQIPASSNHELFEDELDKASLDESDLENSNDSQDLDPKILRQTLLGQKPTNPWETALWVASSLLLIIVLSVQLAYIKRDYLASTYPGITPYIIAICQKISGCQINPKRDLNRLELISRNIYTHPNINGALIINAVLANSASYAQPYPILLVSMSNVRGKIVAQRYFQPSEYLPKNNRGQASLEQGNTTAVNIEILDPGNDALAFELDFY